jgi:hypothetical protein
MKRHYAVMRIMRTKVLSMRELVEGAQGIMYIHSAILDRVQDLRRVSTLWSTVACLYANLFKGNFSQQRLDPEKQLQSFAFGIVGYLSYPWDGSTF